MNKIIDIVCANCLGICQHKERDNNGQIQRTKPCSLCGNNSWWLREQAMRLGLI